MNNMTTRYSKALTAVAAVFTLGASAMAGVVYDNTAAASYSGWSQFSTYEFGDQVTLAGNQRGLDTFSFDYYLNVGNSTKSGNESISFNLYRNDGVNGAPGTSLLPGGASMVISAPQLDTYADPIRPSTAILSFDPTIPGHPFNITLPDTFTWTVLFGGIDAGESAGLLVYNPVTIGFSYNDFWDRSGPNNTWQTKLGAGFNANFGAKITAVPEAGTLGYALLGSLLWIGMAGYRRIAGKQA